MLGEESERFVLAVGREQLVGRATSGVQASCLQMSCQLIAVLRRRPRRRSPLRPHAREPIANGAPAERRTPRSGRRADRAGPEKAQRCEASAMRPVFWAVRTVATANSSPRRIAISAITEGIQPNRIERISGTGLKLGSPK